MNKTGQLISPEKEAMGSESEVLAAFENLVHQVRGYGGGEWGESGDDVVAGVAEVAENAADVVEEFWG